MRGFGYKKRMESAMNQFIEYMRKNAPPIHCLDVRDKQIDYVNEYLRSIKREVSFDEAKRYLEYLEKLDRLPETIFSLLTQQKGDACYVGNEQNESIR